MGLLRSNSSEEDIPGQMAMGNHLPIIHQHAALAGKAGINGESSLVPSIRITIEQSTQR
ncbi:hypothetical protein D3C76_1879970 [compost metagenome]